MKNSCFKKYGIVVLVILSFGSLKAQYNNFKKWSVKEGLPQSDVYSIMQDARGYMWLASGGGVSMFDGIKFKNYTKSNGLSGNLVRCVFEASNGNIWFGTNEGVCYYDGLRFHTLKNKDFKGTSALCFAENEEHALLIGTDDGGINILKFNGDSIQIKNINETNGLGSNSVFDIAIDEQQNIWLATYGGGLNRLTVKNGIYSSVIIKGPSKLPSDMLLSVAIKGDDIWLGSEDAGAVNFSIKKIREEDFSSPLVYNTKSGLNSNYIWNILIAGDNKIWLASMENGINRLEKSGSSCLNKSFTLKNGLSDNQILSLYEDKQANVWIGTNGNGVDMLTGDYFSHFSVADGLPSNKIQSIKQDTANAYWLASSGGGLSQLTFSDNVPAIKNYVDAQGLTNFISSIAIGKGTNKNIWFGTDNNGVVKFNGSKFYNFKETDGLINNRVYSIYVDSKGIVWSGTADGISRYDGVRFLNTSTDRMKMQNEGVKTIIEDPSQNIWFGTSGGLARYKGEGDLRTFDEVEGLKAKDVNAIAAHSSGDIYIGTNTGGLYKYNHFKNDSVAIEFVADDSLLLSNSIRSLQFLNDSVLIAGTFKGFDKIYFDKKFKINRVKHYTVNEGFLGLECNDNALLLDNDKNIWFGTVNGITKYAPAFDNKIKPAPEVFITDVQLFFKDINWEAKKEGKQKWFNVPNTLILPFDQNHLAFKFQANDFNNSQSILYKFKLEGRDAEWSPSRKSNEETFSGLAPGSYKFVVMAQNLQGDWSAPASFSFTITPPWYKTTTFYILLILSIVLLIYGYIKWREKKLVEEKKILEHTVKERTHEVVTQKHLIEEKHKEITDSINYAERIQRSFLASDELLSAYLKNYFVFFKPKDVVSGDFYWASPVAGSGVVDVSSSNVTLSGVEEGVGNFILATADSTGHGVPGAIMSLLNITSLEKAIEHLTDPAEILNNTRQTIIKRLKKDGSAEGGKDGMDCSLILFDFKNKQLHIAAANNPVWIVSKGSGGGVDVSSNNVTLSGVEAVVENRYELIEIKPDKMPVGKHDRDQESFRLQTIDIQEGDMIYTLTDGFPDQFGGEKGKKFMSKNLKELLLVNSHLPMQEQKDLLMKVFRDWVGAAEQVDDVTVIGIRV